MTTAEKRVENAMAIERPICPTLQKHYNFPPVIKEKFLFTPEAQYLFNNITSDVATILQEHFIQGIHGTSSNSWQIVREYFQNKSRIIPALSKNPGTYTMLEKMYHFQPCYEPIDIYFAMGKGGGQALVNRFWTVTNWAIAHVNEVIVAKGNCLMIDIGSGPGRNIIEMCLRNPTYRDRLRVDCIDIDAEAVAIGKELTFRYGLSNIEFVEQSMTRLNERYAENVDYGILIGILCGLTFPERVKLLKALHPYFRPGARLVAASLTDRMAEEDLLCAYILRETTGWGLQYPAYGQMKKAFEEAGWKYESSFTEEPTRFYEIGIGIA